MTEWDGILPPPIENQEPTTRPQSLSPDPSILVPDSEHGQSSGKDEEKVLHEGKSTTVILIHHPQSAPEKDGYGSIDMIFSIWQKDGYSRFVS